ncbi:cytochrome b/b6 domain-containing protein [Ancylobacter sp. Lp-2]|uniref:cytochrome b/b6 domain-containing protein n=1 Tax=Ancylobacter sp. Lp-2 TaxID=2881339 RepID=UPI001E3A3B57|nr:cytochrome b/b6 domain-containing protein [Ancylobacter sp. Lp-2]MCB4770271.1 cytochrome b/b6 domain-containing protein [Ancylobacter sp. Lp-2]
MSQADMSEAGIARVDLRSGADTGPATVLAWDLPTRLAKWSLAALVGLAFASKYYGDVGLVWHMWNGLAILTVLVFRLLWGLVGGSTARFTGFLRGPFSALAYLRGLVTGRKVAYLGHNPLGGWMTIALLAAVAAQAVAGLYTTDDIMVDGPMVAAASSEAISLGSKLHQQIYPILLGLIGLHVVANLAYSLFGGDNLVKAMVTGRKPTRAYADRAAATPGSILAALGCLLLAAVIVFGGIALAGGNPFP